MSAKPGQKTGRFSFSLSFATLALVTAAAIGNLAVPQDAQSQISSKVVKAPALTGGTPHMTTAKLPKAPVQAEMPAPPPIKIFPGLYEPLVATGPVTDEEGKDLDAALKAFHDAPATAGKGSDYEDYAKPLQAFIAAHPNSNWNAALHLDLGLGFYNDGYFSRTFTELEQAWKLGREATSMPARRMIDRAAAELADMHARIGHREQLEALFADIGKRPVSGSARQKMEGAQDGLRMFKGNSSTAYLCGPQALRNVLVTLKAGQKQIKVAEDARSGPHGFSLPELAKLADKAGLKYTLIYRKPGQPVPVPSVINWNIHHYAAIVDVNESRFQVVDPTFPSDAAITAKAIDAEGSGYFLVPATVLAAHPQSGWRIVSAASQEATAVYGMGSTSNETNGVTPGDPTTCCDTPGSQGLSGTHAASAGNTQTSKSQSAPPLQMTTARAHLSAVSLNLTDTPVGYAPQKGLPAFTTLTYNSRDSNQPANFTFSNVGPLWNHTWQAYIQDDPINAGTGVTRVVSGGGGYQYALLRALGLVVYNSSTGGFVQETYDFSQLKRTPTSGTATSYTRNLPDGSSEIYSLSNGATTSPRLVFLTSLVDPAGNTTTFNYDSTFRLTSVVDAMGRSITFTYGLSAYPLLITQITDPFGRSTQLTYDTSQRLASITDPVGITSSFTYGSTPEPDFVTMLTTPYGSSTFSDTPNPSDPPDSSCSPACITRSLAMTDPMGYFELVYLYQNGSVTGTAAESAVPAGMQTDNALVKWRNVYYWNKHAAAGGQVTLDSSGNPIAENWTSPTATIYHWFHQCCSLNYLSNQIGSVKQPLESLRRWTNYNSQAANYYSGVLLRPINDGHVLDDGTTQLEQATYDVSFYGKPLTHIDPVGRAKKYTYAANHIDQLTDQQLTSGTATYTTIATFGSYNSQHEPQTYTGADGQTWHYTYNTAGQLKTVTDPNTNVTTYNYDTSGRLSTIVDANSQTVLTNTYDSADRVQTQTDSQGYTLTYAYDNIDRITSITYPDSTTDLYDYNFQSGPNVGTASLELRKYTDRLGRVTTYDYDADRRLTSVTEPTSGSSTRTTGYSYYEDGTLKEITDANGNVTHWNIDAESRPTSKTYAYGTGSAQTENYVWENTSSRLHSITDALGQVKTFTYTKDDRIAGITYTSTVNPTPNVTFTYDTYFPRLSSMTDGLGTTNYSYTAIGSNGALKLSSIDGPYSNDVIGLTYDAVGRLSGRTITGGNETFGYDAINRLTSHGTPLGGFTLGYLGETDQITSQSVTNGTVTVSTGWGYDTNTNDRRLISITNSGVSRSYTLGYGSGPTNVYDIMSITDTAPTGHPWATQSHGYSYDKIDRLLTESATTPGNSTFAYDNLDNATTWNTPASGSLSPTFNGLNQLSTFGTNTYSYDANGNTLSGDGTKTYKWDAENRLIEVDYTGTSNKSVFSYDGLGRRTVDAETVSGTTTTTRYLWCGAFICQTRDGSDNAFRRDLPEGEYNIGASQKLIYMPDQLGSVRDVIDATTGSLVQSYDYTPYGGVARSTGSVSTDYQYAGLFKHAVSGLNMATYRAQDGNTGRWINRDPIEESGGLNLYGYGAADAANQSDSIGLTDDGEDAEEPDPHVPFHKRRDIPTIQSAPGPFRVPGGGVCVPKPVASPTGAGSATRVSTLVPGPFAKDPIPGHRGPPTASEQTQLNQNMAANGCHTCGDKDAGTQSGNAIGDHQPAQALDDPLWFYPHCIRCMRRQGGEVRQEQRRRLKNK